MTGISDFAAAAKACRHLLRHLDQPAALSTNPLIRAHFEELPDAGAVRELIRALADALTEREREILLRCDLLDEPHKRVARDMGLSMRQFYRDRGAMIEGLAMQLLNRARYVVRLASVIDVAAVQRARVRALQHGGQRYAALALLRNMAQSGTNVDDITSARCWIANILIEQNATDLAADELRQATARFAEARIPNTLAHERIQLEYRNLLWCSARERESVDLEDEALPRVLGLARSQNAAEQHFATEALTMAARRALMRGRFGDAREYLDQALHLLTLRDDAPVETRIHCFLITGVLESALRSGSNGYTVQASALAMRHGLSELAVLTAIGLSIEQEMRGSGASALAHIIGVLPLARECASALNYAHVFLRLGQLQAALGRAQAALAALAEARTAIPSGNYVCTYNDLVSSQAYLALGEFDRARVFAAEAVSSAARQGNKLIQGAAMTALAESYMRMNAKSAAVGAIESSVLLLESSGYPVLLLKAYAIAAQLTGRRRYAQYAEELQQVLKCS